MLTNVTRVIGILSLFASAAMFWNAYDLGILLFRGRTDEDDGFYSKRLKSEWRREMEKTERKNEAKWSEVKQIRNEDEIDNIRSSAETENPNFSLSLSR